MQRRDRVYREECAPLRARTRLYHSQNENVQRWKYRDWHENASRLLTDEMFQCFRTGQTPPLDATRFLFVRRSTIKYKTANTATKRTIQCELVFTKVTQPSTLEIKSGCTW